MGQLVIALILMGTADAGRKSDTIRLLNIEKRYEEAQTKCVKWGGLEADADVDLRGFCAQAHWVNAESVNTVEAWQAFQTQWKGTDWAEQAFKREGKVTLENLGDDASEPEYLAVSDKFYGHQVAEDAKELAGSAAIRDAKSQEDAERIRAEYPEHNGLGKLIELYPGAFYSLSLDDSGKIVIEGNYNTNVKISQPFWGYRTGQGEVVPWTEAIRKHLIESGVPMVHIMKTIQEAQQNGETLSLCPFDYGDTEATIGLAMTVGLTAVFEPQEWSTECGVSDTGIMVYSNRSLLHVSMKPGQDISLGLKRGRRNFTSFVRKSGEPILFEGHIYVPVNKSFAIYPVSGSTPWLTDKPPGAMRTQMDNTLRGTAVPPTWKLQGMGNGIQVSTGSTSEWVLPRGELRFFSPLMQDLLGIGDRDVQYDDSTVPEVSWVVNDKGISEAPENLLPVDSRKLTEEQIKALRYHIGGSGLDPYNLKVVDGYSLDLDGDNKDEKVLRAQYKEYEVAVVLDVDDTFGNRTWIFGTQHAIHGKMAPPSPMSFVVGDQRVFAWSGVEDGTPYVEVIYSEKGSFNMPEMD